MSSSKLSAIGGEVPSDQGDDPTLPYSITVVLEGVADLLFHRWNCDAVEAKARAAKGSKEKKSDNIESYLWRNEENEICLPGEYLRQALVAAAKFQQDPRSPRKSAMDLFKAGLVIETTLASLGIKDWDYLDTRRVMVQRQGVNRVRPAITKGWKATFVISVIAPEYITRERLLEALQVAGRLVGVGDFRPTYGRFFPSIV